MRERERERERVSELEREREREGLRKKPRKNQAYIIRNERKENGSRRIYQGRFF